MASQRIMDSAKCPKCHHSTEWEIWPMIDASTDPKLRDQILDGSLFAWTCSNCGEQIGVLNNLIYKDPKNQFAIMMERDANKDVSVTAEMNLSGEYQSLRVVNSFLNLCERIICFENGLDDRALELYKVLLLSSDENANVDNYICEGTDENGFLMRAWKDGKPAGLFEAPPDLYVQMEALVQKAAKEQKDHFIYIDRLWAMRLFEEEFRQAAEVSNEK